MDIQMGIIKGIILIASGRDIAEGSGINQFPASKGSLKNFTVPSTAVNTPGT
jgi:hypothetical protein